MRCPACGHVIGRYSDVDQLVDLIRRAGGRLVRQAEVQDRLGWTNSRASVTIGRARRRGLIVRAPEGGYVAAPQPTRRSRA